MGALHEALGELAVLREDEAGAREHLAQVDRWFRQTRDPALIARIEQLGRRLSALSKIDDGGTGGADAQAPRMLTILHRLRHGGDHTPSGTAEWSLKQLSEFTAVKEALLFALSGEGYVCVARLGDEVSDGDALTRLVRQRLVTFARDMDAPTCVTDGMDDPTFLEVGEKAYRLVVLSKSEESTVQGALVVPDGTVIPHMLLQTIAERLAATHAGAGIPS